MKTEPIKAYKVFNPDWTCRGFQFEVGREFEMAETPIICSRGFHACLKPNECFSYYSFFPANKCAEVELYGEIVTHEHDSKIASNKIRIIREIPWEEMVRISNIGSNNSGHSNTGHSNTGHSNTGHSNTGDSNTGDSNTGHRNTGDRNTGHSNTGDSNTGHSNTGHRNTGDRNTGHRNTGDRNTGHRNTGDRNTGHSNTGHRNTGHWNTGHWNTGDWNTGHFNTSTPENIFVFNKPCKVNTWDDAYKPRFLYFDQVVWIWKSEMTEEEKKNNPAFETTGGYIKELSYKEAFKLSFQNSDPKDRMKVKNLPNFDPRVFEEISGIKIEDYE